MKSIRLFYDIVFLVSLSTAHRRRSESQIIPDYSAKKKAFPSRKILTPRNFIYGLFICTARFCPVIFYNKKFTTYGASMCLKALSGNNITFRERFNRYRSHCRYHSNTCRVARDRPRVAREYLKRSRQRQWQSPLHQIVERSRDWPFSV